MILVTGAAGTVGRAACRILSANGVPFRAAIHKRGDDELRALATQTVGLDYQDRESIGAAVAGAAAVLFIPPASPDLPVITKNLADCLAGTEVSSVVKISAYGEDASEMSLMGAWHREADEALKASGLPFVILRCMPFMQNILYVAGTMIKPHRAIILPCGGGRVSHIDARDVAAAACAILRSPAKHHGREYALTGGEALTYGDLARIISEETGMEIAYRDVAEEAAGEMLKKVGVPEQVVEAKLVSFRLEKNNLRSRLSPHVKELTGREPTTFREFIRQHRNIFV